MIKRFNEYYSSGLYTKITSFEYENIVFNHQSEEDDNLEEDHLAFAEYISTNWDGFTQNEIDIIKKRYPSCYIDTRTISSYISVPNEISYNGKDKKDTIAHMYMNSNNDIVLFIYKLMDEWFYLDCHLSYLKGSESEVCYKCDQFEGLITLLDSLIKK